MILGLRRPIETDPEVIVQNARAIVGDSPVYALVELITNSDDSYDRMEMNGIRTTGLIHVEFVRKRRGSIFRVMDQAEGFNDEQMDKKIGRYGGLTSGRDKVKIRSYFMRGLKEAMVGMGYGRVRSVKDDHVYECDVDEDAYYNSKEPQKVTSRIKGELGVAETGTEVVLEAMREEVKTPQFETLKEQLQKYFSLRKILQDPKRIVQLVERYEKGGKKREPIKLSYKSPKGEKIYSEKIYAGYQGRKIEAKLEVWRSELPLSGKDEAGPYRENGLLISDGKAIHDITLFKYDNNPDAERIFGELECSYIYELMNDKEQIVSAKRDQLNPRHPFTRALREAAEKALEPVIKEEHKRREKEKEEIETRATRERFKKLLEDLDRIEKEELGKEGTTGQEAGEDKEPAIPENGFAFIPPVTTVVSGKTKFLTLRAIVPHTIPLNKEIKVESDSEEISVLTPIVKFDKTSIADRDIASKSVKIEGRQVGTLGVITARFGQLLAECIVQVRSKPKESSPDGATKNKSGLFKDIKFDPTEDPRYRVNFDRTTGIITIATSASSVKMYLGPYGKNQDEKYARVLIAELVTDAVCRELARRRIEIGRATYPQSNPVEAINFERARLINDYAHRIHKRLAG